jgi:two-component system chemotaxis sensor kinase CheA
MEIDNELLLKTFVTENEDGLACMEQALLELESHPDDAELLNTVFRVIHSFKGNAAIFELKHAQEFAHALEDLLDKIRSRQRKFSPAIADILLASQDVMRELATHAVSGTDAATPQSKKLLQRIHGQVEGKPGRVHASKSQGRRQPQSRQSQFRVMRLTRGRHRSQRVPCASTCKSWTDSWI